MYKCKKCGEVFDEPKKIVSREYLDGMCISEDVVPVCLDCMSSDVEEAFQCAICKCAVTEDEFSEYEIGSGRVCEYCAKDVEKMFKEMMKDKFTQDERELVNLIFDGEEL